MKNLYDSIKHVRGESQFIDDLPVQEGTLFGAVYYSNIAHGKILKLDFSEALKMNGVAGIISAKDIPGENQIGGVIRDENLFAEETLHFIAHPIALAVADSYLNARAALKKIKIVVQKHPHILDPREAAVKNELIIPPRKFELGNVDEAWKDCEYIIEGKVESGGQEHLYLETQGAYSFKTESGGIKIFSATQAPTAVQRTVANILNLPMNKIEVDVQRLGGGFGGKEDQATAWACMSALAAYKLNRPVKLILKRQDDIRLTGKRHPYSSDYKIGLDREGKILAYETVYYQNAGASADLSTAILDRTLFHSTNSYFIPNVRAVGLSCRTNLPPNTAFRGFGGPQGMFVIESAIHKAAAVLKKEPVEIQKLNLLDEGDEFPYGQKTFNCSAKKSFEDLDRLYPLKDILRETDEFNARNTLVKKGSAVMPICFGISFTTTFLNQASALVHIYTDGSVSINTAAVEMGQGVNEKMKRIASRVLNIAESRIKIESTNTSRVSNTSPTAASKGTDLNGFAVIDACTILKERLSKVAAEEFEENDLSAIYFKNEKVFYEGEPTNLTFADIVKKAYSKRVSLTAQAHHSTPEINFDAKINKGHPFSYHVYGAAVVQATLDCLRGTYDIDSVRVVHDFGESFHPVIDLGQAEGGILQGLGWMTMEELKWNEEGKLLTDALSTYKVPDIHSMPRELKIHFLEKSQNDFGPLRSKAVGEPPFMYGIGAYFALANAMKAFKPDLEINYTAPLTPENVLLTLYNNTIN